MNGQEKRKEASFIAEFKENREMQYHQFLSDRRLRLRSSVFDLPEFAKNPMVSFVILINSQDEFSKVEAFIKKYTSDMDLQIVLLCLDGLVLPKSGVELTIHSIDLKIANPASWLNQFAVNMIGKILCLMVSFENFDGGKLLDMINKIKDNESSQLYVHDSLGRVTGIAMACDAFYLARGLDELIEDVEIALLDLALRMEMLGCQIEARIWPQLDIPSMAEKNIRIGRLTVNQGSGSFGYL